MFEFNGKLVTGNSTNSPSWYAYKDASGNVTVSRYTRGLPFENAGEYFVYVTYENLINEPNQQVQNGKENQNTHQIFYFEITNTPPEVTVYAQNDSNTPTLLSSESARILSVDDYTNQYVYASWETPGPFDASISARYVIYDWEGNVISGAQPLELRGLVYQQGKGSKFQVSTHNPTLLFGERKSVNSRTGIDGYYQIQIYKNNSLAYVNHTFYIETAPITGISGVQVVGNRVLQENNEPVIFSRLDASNPNSFNLTTNTSFGWTWNEKQSNAPITAQYLYASINKTSNFDINSEVTVSALQAQANSGAVYMPTNATLGGFTPAMEYKKINLDTESLATDLLSSQIINTTQLAILLLSDAAGNTAIFATILDNTDTQVLQIEPQTAYVNVITKDTNFYWGTHKSIRANDISSTDGVIADIYDFVSNDYNWTLNNNIYESNAIIKNAFTNMNVTATNSINLALKEVRFSANDGYDSSYTPRVFSNGSTQFAQNWFATVTVTPGATSTDAYTSKVLIDGNSITTAITHTLDNGEFRYTLYVWDSMNNSNAGGLNIEVNLDKSLGSLRSYNEFLSADGLSLDYNRNPNLGEITDRQYVSNNYSTNRRFLTFSWTEPQEHFKIKTITLDFYPFAYAQDSENYPYSEQSTQVTLYDSSTGYDLLNKVTKEGISATYYQTNILMKIEFSKYFNDSASQEGKYVITRTYDDEGFDEAHLEGDVKVKTYTYYLDRNNVISNDKLYGDVNLQFGYNKGEYENYPNYPNTASGKIVFDEFGRATTTDTFNSINFDTTNLRANAPNSIVIDSNILPASVMMSWWQEKNSNGLAGNYIYDKYYYSVDDAFNKLNEVLGEYKYSSRMQVAVQFFARNSTSNYAFSSQTFYSTKPSTTNGTLTINDSRSLTELNKAFTSVGRYRVILFDLANYDGILSGNPYTDFTKLSYATLTPNYTVINFELTGQAPTFNYQVGLSNYTNIDVTIQNITNESKARITWSDPSDIYTAQIAFNDITITKKTYTKDSPRLNRDGTDGNSASTETRVFSNPILLTCDATEKTLLSQDPNEVEGVTYIYKETQDELWQIVNNGLSVDKLMLAEFYKMKVNGIYNYYLLLPRAEIEDITKNENKLADVEYQTTVHYIAKDSNDYIVNGNLTNYQKTQNLYVDNTAPYWNLIDLIENDVYINSISDNFADYLIENLDNPDVTFLKSYAFAVNTDFMLNYRNEYESGTYFYYCERTDYDGSKIGQTTVTSQEGYESAPRFDKGLEKYVRATYQNIDEGITGSFPTKTGYYDIIEQDRAGNLRVYTVYVTENEHLIDASINESNIDISTNINSTQVMVDNVLIFDNAEQIIFNSKDFAIDSITTQDYWLKFKFQNQMNPTDVMEYYLAPTDAIFDLDIDNVTDDINVIISAFNTFIDEVSLKEQLAFGSQILVTISSRLNISNTDLKFYINTEGQLLINSEADFLNLITPDASNGIFTLKLPNTTNIPSTKLTAFNVFRNGDLQAYDTTLTPLPTLPHEFESEEALNGYIFTLANNVTYKFEFIDNFARKVTYSYPVDSSLIKRVEFSGETIEYAYNDTLYTYTSDDVRFIYQSSGLRIKLSITNFDTGEIIYQKSVTDEIDTQSPYFDFIQETLSSNIITLKFNADLGIHYYVHIEADNYTDTATKFDFVIYTHLPDVKLTDTSGSPIVNNITSKEVLISWNEITALFNPYVQITYPDGSSAPIESGVSVINEGTYTINLINDLGTYDNGTITFIIQEYAVSVYGVYQVNSTGELIQLFAHSSNYTYYFDNVATAIPHYMFLSNDSNWDRNIKIVCNEDKGLNFEVIAEYGNTRIYRVYGDYSYVLEVYFAVTRIPSLNISAYTNFRIDGDTTTRSSEFKTSAVNITWQTTFTDNTAQPDGTFNNIYSNFFTLELRYNGTLVGNYTTGSITLINSGIYEIRILDPVGQVHYFGLNSNATRFNLTLLTNVIYTVNDNAAIPYATYSSDVDVYIPNLEYYDSAPTIEIFRNNKPYTITPTESHYVFNQAGVYRINMRSSIQNIKGTSAEDLVATYQFTIVSPNEALKTYEFTSMTGYEIISIIRSGTDITEEIRGENEKILNLKIDEENIGIGRYEITVNVAKNGYIPSQNYTFNIWINNETATITPSRDWGTNETSAFTLTVNPTSVYEKIGDCSIVVNGVTVLTINAENGATENVEPVTLEPYTEPGDYVIQLVSASGNILESHRITIKVPFNTAAIILMVVACAVVIGLVITFIIMRHRVKVR